MEASTYDLIVVGGGSGGFGAALAASRRGCRVLLIEREPVLGGTSTQGGVNTWEPGVGGPGFHGELFQRLSSTPNAIGISRTVKYCQPDTPWGESRIDRSGRYQDTLRRYGLAPDCLRRVTFEPAAMAGEMATMLSETGRGEIWTSAQVVSARSSCDRVQSVDFVSGGVAHTAGAPFFIDSTGDIALCRMLGCAAQLGCEPRDQYDEPSAPDSRQDALNGVSLLWRIALAENATSVEPAPGGSDSGKPFIRLRQNTPWLATGMNGGANHAEAWQSEGGLASAKFRKDSTCVAKATPAEQVAPRLAAGSFIVTFCLNEYPCGDFNINPLPLMEGWEFHRLGPAAGRAECLRRLNSMWRWLRTEKGFDRFVITRVFPMTGVREGPRLVARRVLAERDLRAGLAQGPDSGHWIAVADHALDVHGTAAGGCCALSSPYGIPYECLLPKEFANMAVACRGAGFSHLAASSCRLSRTMMQLGHAAGLAVAVALNRGCSLPKVEAGEIRSWLAEDNAAMLLEK